MVLFGPSGSGKTMTLESIAGLVSPDEGEIVLDGQVLFRRGASGDHVNLPARKRGIGYVFQSYALFPHLTVLQNVRYPLGRDPDSRARALTLVDQMGLGPLTERLPHELSESELARLQTRMHEAGIFDLPEMDRPQRVGDPTDPNFKKAWQRLASLSLETGKSMTTIINDRRTARQAALGEDALGLGSTESVTGVLLTDPARIRTSANTIAAASIGRRLTPDEQTELVSYVHELERRNKLVQEKRDEIEAQKAEGADEELWEMAALDETTEAGARIEQALARGDITDPDTPDSESEDTGDETGEDEFDTELGEMVVADIDARMQESIRRENPVEAGANDMAQQYETFQRLLAGPGRRVG
jgi:ABC-type proline/glycine betaine transport system ATPase subunit